MLLYHRSHTTIYGKQITTAMSVTHYSYKRLAVIIWYSVCVFRYSLYQSGDTPKLKDAFEKLLPVAADWNNIGVLLGIRDNTLREIKHNERHRYDCLREMLSEWLKTDNPPPTWNSLADAVKLFNAAKAQEIRNCIAE